MLVYEMQNVMKALMRWSLPNLAITKLQKKYLSLACNYLTKSKRFEEEEKRKEAISWTTTNLNLFDHFS
jgi:hypothetical protein